MKKKKRPSKKICERLHAKKRFWQRYNIRLTTADLDAMVKQIQLGAAIFIKRSSRRVTIWEVSLQGNPAKVAYDSRTQTIITAFPKPEVEPQKEMDHES